MGRSTVNHTAARLREVRRQLATRSYVLNGWYPGSPVDKLGIIWHAPTIYSQVIHAVSKPSETIALLERPKLEKLGKAYRDLRNASHQKADFIDKGIPMPHGLFRGNYLIVDGHVEGIDFWDTLYPYDASPGDVRGSMWDAQRWARVQKLRVACRCFGPIVRWGSRGRKTRLIITPSIRRSKCR